MMEEKLFDLLTETYKAKIDYTKDLKDYLKEKTKNQLLYVFLIYAHAANYSVAKIAEDITKLNNKKKDEVVDELILVIDKCLINVISFLDENEIDKIKELANTNKSELYISFEEPNFPLVTIKNLEKLALIYCKKEKDKVFFHMPKHVKNNIKSIAVKSGNDDYKKIIRYTEALIRVYGAINLNEAYEIIKEKINVDCEKYFSVIVFISMMELETFGYSFEFNSIYDINIYEDELYQLMNSENEIVKYDLDFYEDMINNKYLFNLKEYKKFRNYLNEYYGFDINEEDFFRGEILEDYAGISQVNEERAEEILIAALEREFELNEVDKMMMIAYIKNITKRMPQWKLGGKINSEEIKRKIGRNELCPCESGKKYKKCCGK